MALRQVALLAVMGALATMLASGCTKQELIQKFAPAQDQAMAKQYMDDLREGAIDKIEAHVDPIMQSPTLPATLQRMAALVPHQPPDSVKLVGAQSMHASGRTTRNLTFEYGFHGHVGSPERRDAGDIRTHYNYRTTHPAPGSIN